MNINPAEYYRNSKEWKKLLGKTGVVVFATQLQVASPELELFLPYCFLLVELENFFENKKVTKQRIEIMGEAKTEFKIGERVVLELRKIAIPDDTGIIPYGLKACKI